MDNILIREATIDDAEKLREIYSYYVLNTAISFEYEVPSVDEFKNRIQTITDKYPYLVCVKDNTIVGYAYASAYSTRNAYSWTAASSIYVDKDQRRHGIGTALYVALETKLHEMGIVNIVAGAAYAETEDEYMENESYKFHINRGFVKVAHFKGIGRKFDRWYDLMWFQKKLEQETE